MQGVWTSCFVQGADKAVSSSLRCLWRGEMALILTFDCVGWSSSRRDEALH